jgi:hypothetical protein
MDRLDVGIANIKEKHISEWNLASKKKKLWGGPDVLAQRILSQFATNARLLVPSKGYLGMKQINAINLIKFQIRQIETLMMSYIPRLFRHEAYVHSQSHD